MVYGIPEFIQQIKMKNKDNSGFFYFTLLLIFLNYFSWRRLEIYHGLRNLYCNFGDEIFVAMS